MTLTYDAITTITETITEKELIMPRVDSTEIVSIAELATKTIVQVQVGILNEDGDFLPNGGGSGVVILSINTGLYSGTTNILLWSNTFSSQKWVSDKGAE